MRVPRLSLQASASYLMVQTEESVTREGIVEHGKQLLMRVVDHLGLRPVVRRETSNNNGFRNPEMYFSLHE